MPASSPRSRGASDHPRPCTGHRPALRTSAASRLVLATRKLDSITGRGTSRRLVARRTDDYGQSEALVQLSIRVPSQEQPPSRLSMPAALVGGAELGRWESIFAGAAVSGIYIAAAKFGLHLSVAHGVVTPVWPPTGIALAALLLLGRRFWPAVALGALIANATTGASVPEAL